MRLTAIRRGAIGLPFPLLAGPRCNWLALPVGAAIPLAFAPFGLYPLAVLALAALFLLWEDVPPRRAAWRGFLFGIGCFLAGIYWIYISLHTFGKAPLFIAVPLMLALVCIMAFYAALVGFVANRWCAQPGALRWLAALPAAWALAEWLRGWLASGFPWLALGYSQSDSALAGLAPVLGVYGVGWAVALSAGGLVALARGGLRTRAVAAVAVAVLWLAAAALRPVEWTVAEDTELRVRILQGGVGQDRKWLPDELEPTKELYRSLTQQDLGVDLVVWPEAAIPALLRDIAPYLASVLGEAASHGTAVVLGVVQYDDLRDQYLNSVLGFDGHASFYHKRHLVPFGEYFPVPDTVRSWMRLMNLPYVDFSAGDADQPPLELNGHEIGVSICYEDLFGEELLQVLPEAVLLINVSNDAWFGGSIAPHQHLQIARLRALEAGRYLLRATNTGISAVIGPDGALIATSPQFQTHVLAAVVRPHRGATPYARVGNLAVVLAATLVLAGAALAARRRRPRTDQG